jgi:hypothetical protein
MWDAWIQKFLSRQQQQQAILGDDGEYSRRLATCTSPFFIAACIRAPTISMAFHVVLHLTLCGFVGYFTP